MLRRVSHDHNFTNGRSVSGHVISLVILRIYKVLYNFDTFLYQFFETGTSDGTNIGHDQLLKILDFSLYPLSFYLYSPILTKNNNSYFCVRWTTHDYNIKKSAFKNECFYLTAQWREQNPSWSWRFTSEPSSSRTDII